MIDISVKDVVEISIGGDPSYTVSVQGRGLKTGAFSVPPDVAAAILSAAKDDGADVSVARPKPAVTRWTVRGRNAYGRLLPDATRRAYLDPQPQPDARVLRARYGQAQRRKPLTGRFM